jgi:hypothetical protein
MLKTENSIILTCFEDESYFSCFTFTNTNRILFSASAKGWVICVYASTCIIFRYFCLCVCEFFYFLIRSGEQIMLYNRSLLNKELSLTRYCSSTKLSIIIHQIIFRKKLLTYEILFSMTHDRKTTFHYLRRPWPQY